MAFFVCGRAPEDAREVHYEQVQAQIWETREDPEEQQQPREDPPPPAEVAEEADDMVGVFYPRNFSVDEMIKLEHGVTNLPGMEHKWVVEYRGRDAPDGPYVRFVRSWSGELLFVMPVNESRRSSGIFFVKRSLYEEHTEEDINHLFDILLNVVVFKERFPYDFQFGEPVSMMWWSWIGIYVTNAHVTD
jgi:hypothetical protein